MNATINEFNLQWEVQKPFNVELAKTDKLPEQTKTVEITKNGTFTITADDGYALKTVNCKVDADWISGLLLHNCRLAFSTLTEFDYDVNWPTDLSMMFYKCTNLKSTNSAAWDMSKVTSINSMFFGCTSLEALDVSNWNIDSLTYVTSPFEGCTKLKTLNCENWDVSKLSITGLFRNTYLEYLDLTTWRPSTVANVFNGSGNIKTIIGDHSLEEVEAGEVVCFEGASNIDLDGLVNVRYASVLACLKGMNTDAGRVWLKTQTYNNCYNDDDTVPDAATLAARQAELKALSAEKNKSFVLG